MMELEMFGTWVHGGEWGYHYRVLATCAARCHSGLVIIAADDDSPPWDLVEHELRAAHRQVHPDQHTQEISR